MMKPGLALDLLIREWNSRPSRFLLTVASVAIGSAAVFGGMLATTSAREAYHDMSAALEGPPALEIVSERGGRFPLTDVPDLSSVEGIEASVPLIFRTSLLRQREQRASVLIVGTALDRPQIVRQLRLQSGTMPEKKEEVGISSALAEALHVDVGDSVTLLSRRGLRKLQVVGLVQQDSLQQFAGGASLLMPLSSVQELFSLRGQVDRLRLDLRSTTSREQVKERVAARIPSPFIVQLPQGRIRLAEELMRSADLALMMACTMAMAVAVFIVLNTIRMNVSERRRQLSIMRCLGATSRQVESLVMTEAFVAGSAGALLGIPLGYAVGWGIARGIEGVLDTQIPALTLSWMPILLPLISGPLLAVAAAWFPARQARKISPAEGIRETELVGYERFPWTSVLAGALAWVLGTACLLAVQWRWIPSPAAIPTAILMLVAYVLWTPVFLRPILRATAWLIRGRFEWARQLGCEQLIRCRTRTGLTAGVIVVALNSSIGLGHGILNNVDDIRDWYRRTFVGDFFLQALSPLVSAVPGQEDPLREALSNIPGVKNIDTIRLLPGRAGDQPVVCIVRDFFSASSLPLQLVQSTEAHARSALVQGQAVVSTVLAERLNLRPGDNLLVELNGRSHRFQIGALASDYFQGGLALYVDRRAVEKRFETGLPDFYSVSAEPAARVAIEPQLREIARRHSTALFSNAEGQQRFDRRINGIVGALWAVVGVTFLASGLGIANTLSVNVLEQTRELGLMRIIGMTARQVRAFILIEAWLLGFVGLTLGIVGGLSTAYVTHLCNAQVLGHSPPFAWHFQLLGLSILASLLLVSLGAWGPGYRASRLNLLTAIAYE